jgi:hypothetical protein
MFVESKRYVGMRLQAGVPAVDADFNDLSDSLVFQIRRTIQRAIGDGAPFGNNGFKIAQAGVNSNNFKITGGDGTDEGAGQFFLAGLPARLNSDADYVSISKDIHPQVAAVVPLVLTDDTASYTVGELVGRDLCPDVDFPATVFAITANTATTITIGAGNLTLATSVGKHYRVNLTTPGAPRTDEVYLDAFLDEVSAAEDPNLVHSLGGPPAPTNAAFRLVLRQLVKVREGAVAPTASIVDGLGRRHWFQRLAVVARTASALITTAMLSDGRPVVSRPNGVALLATVSGIDGLVVAETDLYTVPQGKTVIPTMTLLRATVATAITSPPTAGVGIAAGADDVFAAQILTGLLSTAKAWAWNAAGIVTPALSGEKIKLGIDAAAVGTTLTLEAQLYGREI